MFVFFLRTKAYFVPVMFLVSELVRSAIMTAKEGWFSMGASVIDDVPPPFAR